MHTLITYNTHIKYLKLLSNSQAAILVLKHLQINSQCVIRALVNVGDILHAHLYPFLCDSCFDLEKKNSEKGNFS